MAQMDIKTFILLCLLALLPLLFLANQSSSNNEIGTTLDLSLNSSSNWTQLRLEGAIITDLQVLDPVAHIERSDNAILMVGPGKARVKPRIKVTQDQVRLYLSKDLMGRASAEINGVGRLDNLQQPLTIPISLQTNSSLAKINFNGLIIKQSTIEDLKGAANRPVITNDSVSLASPLGDEVELDLLARTSVYDEFPTIVLEKGDKGMFQAKVGNYTYSNNKTGKRTIRNLPVKVEMTSNMTQILFKGGEISQGKIDQIDNQSLQTSIIGDNFVFLKYAHNGTAFRRASFLLDMNYSQGDGLDIYKNNSGFVGVKIGDRSYFLANSSKSDSYVSQSYPLSDLIGGENPYRSISVPLIIETTSDWTDVILEGLEGTEIIVNKIEGNISQPSVSNGIISIRKGSSEDISMARVEAILKANSQSDGSIRIEKGDHGYTKVTMGMVATYNNMGKTRGDPRNRMRFQLPLLPMAAAFNIVYNPMAYILPVYSELYDQGLTIGDTQPKEVSLSISSAQIPSQGPRFSIPVAEGVRIYIFIALLILLVFSATMMRLEVHLGLSKTSCRDAVWKQLKELGEQPLSSALVTEALAAVAVIPLLLVNVGTIATLVMMIAYLGLAVALILRLSGIRSEPYRDANRWFQVRKETFALLLGAASYFTLFELLAAMPEIGPNISRILLLTTAVAMCLIYIILIHPNRRGYREGLWNMAASNLENMPISSVIILEALIALGVTPFLLLSIEAIANSAAILAYLLLVAGVALRFVEMKDLLRIDKQKEILIKFLSLAVLPAAGIMGAFELMKVNLRAGQIFLALMVIAAVILPVSAYQYLRNRNLDL